MQSPPPPSDEPQRLEALLDYRILDTESERVFDELAELAAAICGTGSAAISLVDRDRQWFKATHNMGPARQTPREHSVCAHAILEPGWVEIADTRGDPRTSSNPLLLENGIRYYGGKQLRTQSGHAIGMLCVLDVEPRTLSPVQRRALEQLADVVMALLDARRREMHLHWLGQLLDEVSEEVLVMDATTYRYIYANQHARQQLGYETEEMQAMSPADITPSLTPGGFADLMRRAHAGEHVHYEGVRRRRDGSTYPSDARWQVLQLAGRPFVFSIVRDLTEAKKIERMKDDFVSTVSHELRTPLTSIRGPLALLHRGSLGELPEPAARMVALAHEQTERLVCLVDDILDLDMAASGKMTLRLESLTLDALALDLERAHALRAKELGVRLAVDLPPNLCARADPQRLLQVLGNFISNALKFAPAGSAVTVAAHREGEDVRIEVRDEGPGVPETFRALIFQRFAQADAGDATRRGGTGLGLAISRHLATLMAGRVGFESRPGDTRFHIDLPASPAEEKP